jgi:hypothetical protein
MKVHQGVHCAAWHINSIYPLGQLPYTRDIQKDCATHRIIYNNGSNNTIFNLCISEMSMCYKYYEVNKLLKNS